MTKFNLCYDDYFLDFVLTGIHQVDLRCGFDLGCIDLCGPKFHTGFQIQLHSIPISYFCKFEYYSIQKSKFRYVVTIENMCKSFYEG